MFVIVPTEKLIVTENPVHEQDVTLFKESIQRVGLLYPLLVAKNGDFYHIVDGRTRFKALKHLGWTDIPCFVINDYIEDIAKYEVEICRRHLSSKEIEVLQRRALEELSKKLSDMLTELRAVLSADEIKAYEEKAKHHPWTVYSELCLIKSAAGVADKLKESALKESKIYKEKEVLAKRCVELEERLQKLTAQLNESERKHRELVQQIEKVKRDEEARLEKLVQEKLREINRDANVKDYEKLRKKLEAEIRKEIEEEKMKEIEEIIEQRNKFSKEAHRINEEKKRVEEELRKMREEYKNLALYIEKIKDENAHKNKVIQQAFNTGVVLKRIKGMQETISELHQEALSLINYIHLLPETGVNIEKEHLIAAVDSIEGNIKKFEGGLTELKKAIRAIKK